MKKDRNKHRTGRSVAFHGELIHLSELQTAVLRVAIVRFHAFRARFDREPRMEEPLFFDPSCDEPVRAAAAEIRKQVIEAARLTASDCTSLLTFFGLDQPESTVPLRPSTLGQGTPRASVRLSRLR
jgi:hypothetical protein